MADSEIKKMLKEGKLSEAAEIYIAHCAGEDKFPNMAGFCRFCQIGQSELDEIGQRFPIEYENLCSALEDEALNSRIAAAIINPYMKRYLGYGDEKKNDDEPVTVYFEHDILKDGK